MDMQRVRVLIVLAGITSVQAAASAQTESRVVPVTLAQGGRAAFPVVVAKDASEPVRTAAAELAHYLGRISGAKFEVGAGDGRTGLAIGLVSHFPGLPFHGKWKTVSVGEREDYLIRTHARGVYLLGATELAVPHAVWDFLYRLGHRQFFPGETWEVVPSVPEPTLAIDVVESPDYRGRRIWYGFGAWDYAREPYAQWCRRNRMASGVELRTGHAYDGIVRALKKDFDQHPEFWPLLNGQRKPVRNPKPCLSNAALRALIVRHAVAQFDKDPSLDSVSMDPSDGGGWCECAGCAKLGTVTDQALLLANEVAAAISAKHPGKFVGMYAYNYHSPPPGIRVHPNVIVSVATAFIKGGHTIDELISGWSAKGATLGIREYYSVNTWDRDQPGHARGGNLDYLRRTIPDFHAKGARFLSAESSDNWGPNGLGYYVASRMLWDVREAQRIDALVEDFLARSFGPAREPMRQFYQQIDGSRPHLVVDDQLGRMYRALQEARGLARAPEIRVRIDALVLYARYATLYHRYATSDGAARQTAFEALIRHAYRMRKTMLVHTLALYRDLDNRDKTVAIPAGAEYRVPEERNPWKSSAPFGEAEIVGFLNEGMAGHKLVELPFKPVEYSDQLAPAAERLKFPADLPVGEIGPGRGAQTFFTYVEKAPATVELQITGGLIAHYRDRGNVKVELWRIGGASRTGERETLSATDRSVPPDGVQRTVKLPVNEPGLYKLVVSDGGDRTQVKWPAGQPMTIHSTPGASMNAAYGQWMGYFYVPKGTKVIGLFGGQHGEVRDSQDRPHFWLNGREPNYYSVPVPPGQDGRLWRVRYVRGPLHLLTVPPYFALCPQGLLLPKEVLEKDAGPERP